MAEESRVAQVLLGRQAIDTALELHRTARELERLRAHANVFEDQVAWVATSLSENGLTKDNLDVLIDSLEDFRDELRGVESG